MFDFDGALECAKQCHELAEQLKQAVREDRFEREEPFGKWWGELRDNADDTARQLDENLGKAVAELKRYAQKIREQWAKEVDLYNKYIFENEVTSLQREIDAYQIRVQQEIEKYVEEKVKEGISHISGSGFGSEISAFFGDGARLGKEAFDTINVWDDADDYMEDKPRTIQDKPNEYWPSGRSSDPPYAVFAEYTGNFGYPPRPSGMSLV